MSKTPAGRWRIEVVYAALMLAVVGLGVRLWLLMRDRRADGLRLANQQQRMTIPLPARVGSIYIRTRGRYVPLADSRRVPLCYVDPGMLKDDELADTAIRLGEALGEDPVEIQNELLFRRDRRYVPIRRDLTPEQVAAVQSLKLPAVGINHEWWRTYPNGTLGATVVGFRRRDGVPGGGLEATQQEHLAAVPGKRVVLADARRRAIWPLPDQSRIPRNGQSVYLCLDAYVQRFLQEAVNESVAEFGAKWGAGVVVDPNSGEVLAMCSSPTFDPNDYATASLEQQTNRAVCVPFEPGSIAKPIFAAGAVDYGLMTYRTRIDTGNGVYHAPRGGKISDHGTSYGTITLAEVVVVSSNVGMAKVGEALTNKRIHEIALRFGFGQKTSLPLPGQSAGIIRDLRKWDGYSMRRVPFGQEMACTALQMTMAFCSLANGGLLLAPRLIDSIADPAGQVIWTGKRHVVRRVLKPGVAAETLGVLQEVVERGTGKACKLDRWTVFGKTGTAQIPGRGGYVSGAYTGSFVGGAPASKPRVICLISIYWPERSKGYYGGKVAAPYVRRVLERTLAYLEVPPDKTPTATARGGREKIGLANSRPSGR